MEYTVLICDDDEDILSALEIYRRGNVPVAGGEFMDFIHCNAGRVIPGLTRDPPVSPIL